MMPDLVGQLPPRCPGFVSFMPLFDGASADPRNHHFVNDGSGNAPHVLDGELRIGILHLE
jgi:hypothetical protein